jgi:hypothetical protein
MSMLWINETFSRDTITGNIVENQHDNKKSLLCLSSKRLVRPQKRLQNDLYLRTCPWMIYRRFFLFFTLFECVVGRVESSGRSCKVVDLLSPSEGLNIINPQHSRPPECHLGTPSFHTSGPVHHHSGPVHSFMWLFRVCTSSKNLFRYRNCP